MSAITGEKLAEPRNYRLKRRQVGALETLAEIHDDISVHHFVRTFVDFGLKLTRMNNNQIPLLDQVRLQRLMANRAQRDAKRNKR